MDKKSKTTDTPAAQAFKNKVCQEEANRLKEKNQHIRNRAREKMDEELATDCANQLKAIRERRFSKDRDGNTISDWDLARKKMDEIISADTTAYNSEWRMAFLSLVGAQHKLAIAMFNTLDQHVYLNASFAIRGLINEKLRKPAAEVADVDVGKEQIPVIMHNVTLNDKGELEISLSQYDHVPMGDEFNEVFKDVIKDWLKEQGYTPGVNQAEAHCFFDSTGKKLDQATFDALKNDKGNGFQAYLEANSELAYSPRP